MSHHRQSYARDSTSRDNQQDTGRPRDRRERSPHHRRDDYGRGQEDSYRHIDSYVPRHRRDDYGRDRDHSYRNTDSYRQADSYVPRHRRDDRDVPRSIAREDLHQSRSGHSRREASRDHHRNVYRGDGHHAGQDTRPEKPLNRQQRKDLGRINRGERPTFSVPGAPAGALEPRYPHGKGPENGSKRKRDNSPPVKSARPKTTTPSLESQAFIANDLLGDEQRQEQELGDEESPFAPDDGPMYNSDHDDNTQQGLEQDLEQKDLEHDDLEQEVVTNKSVAKTTNGDSNPLEADGPVDEILPGDVRRRYREDPIPDMFSETPPSDEDVLLMKEKGGPVEKITNGNLRQEEAQRASEGNMRLVGLRQYYDNRETGSQHGKLFLEAVDFFLDWSNAIYPRQEDAVMVNAYEPRVDAFRGKEKLIGINLNHFDKATPQRHGEPMETAWLDEEMVLNLSRLASGVKSNPRDVYFCGEQVQNNWLCEGNAMGVARVEQVERRLLRFAARLEKHGWTNEMNWMPDLKPHHRRTVMPVQTSNHWILLVIEPDTESEQRIGTIRSFNSWNGGISKHGEKIGRALVKVMEQLPGLDWRQSSWNFKECPTTKQVNAVDCGIITVSNAAAFLRGEEPHVVSSNVGGFCVRERTRYMQLMLDAVREIRQVSSGAAKGNANSKDSGASAASGSGEKSAPAGTLRSDAAYTKYSEDMSRLEVEGFQIATPLKRLADYAFELLQVNHTYSDAFAIPLSHGITEVADGVPLQFQDVKKLQKESMPGDAWATDNLMEWALERLRPSTGPGHYIAKQQDVAMAVPRHTRLPLGQGWRLAFMSETVEMMKKKLVTLKEGIQNGDEVDFPLADMPASTTQLSLPYNINNKHWCLVHITVNESKTKGTVGVYDSKGRYSIANVKAEIPVLLESLQTRQDLGWQNVKWSPIAVKLCPQQANSSDCGFFTLNALEHVMRDQTWTQDIMGRSAAERERYGYQLRWSLLRSIYSEYIREDLPVDAPEDKPPPKEPEKRPENEGPKRGGNSKRGEKGEPKKESTKPKPKPKPKRKATNAAQARESDDEALEADFVKAIDRVDIRQLLCNIMLTQVEALWSKEDLLDRVWSDVKAWAEETKLSIDVEDETIVRSWTSITLANSPATFVENQDGSSYQLDTRPGHLVDSETQTELISTPEGEPILKDLASYAFSLAISIVRSSGPLDDQDKFDTMHQRAKDQMTAFSTICGSLTTVVEDPATTWTDVEASFCDGNMGWIPYCYCNSSTKVLLEDAKYSGARRVVDCLDQLNLMAKDSEQSLSVALLQSGPDGSSSNNESWSGLASRWPNLSFQLVMFGRPGRLWNEKFFNRTDKFYWASFDTAKLGVLYSGSRTPSEDESGHARFLTACTLVDHMKTDIALSVRHEGARPQRNVQTDLGSKLTHTGRKSFSLETIKHTFDTVVSDCIVQPFRAENLSRPSGRKDKDGNEIQGANEEFACPIKGCMDKDGYPKTFARDRYLKDHLRYVHGVTEWVHCPYGCKDALGNLQSFSRRGGLGKHLQRHHPDEPKGPLD